MPSQSVQNLLKSKAFNICNTMLKNDSLQEDIVLDSENMILSLCNNFSMEERRQLNRSCYFGVPKMKKNYRFLNVMQKKNVKCTNISFFLFPCLGVS